MYIHVRTRFYSSTGLLMPLQPAHVCTNCLTSLIPVTRLWRYSFSAWIGTSRLARQAFQSQSCQNCSRKQSIFLTFFRKTSLIRPGKRASGILKRPTAFCIRSAKLYCGETRITPRVRHQRYVQCVCTRLYIVHYMYIHVMIQFISVYHVYRHVYTAYRPVRTDFQSFRVFCSMHTLRTSKQWPTFRITRMFLCVSCVSMLVPATCSTTRPCSRNLTSILHQIPFQTSMRLNVQLFLTVI